MFCDFLFDDQVRKQSAMSKRGQEATSNEGSPMAKTRPCLVARDPQSEEISSQILGSQVNPGNTDERKRSGNSRWKQLSIRIKIRNRVLSSESTREGSNAAGNKLAGGATPNTP